MLWLIIPGILLLLCLLPLGIGAVYGKQGPKVYLIIWKVKIPLYPRKPKKPKKEKVPVKPSGNPPRQENKQEPVLSKGEKPTKEAKQEASPAKGNNPPEEAKQEEEALWDFEKLKSLLHLLVPFLGDLRRKIRITRLQGYLLLAGGDPCDLAVNYGRAWAALGNLQALLSRVFVIKKRDLQVGCDFAGDNTLFYGRADITITLGRLLGLVLRYGWKLLKSTKMKKGGGVK